MGDDAQRARVIALLGDSLDLYAAVTAVCRVLPEDRAFAIATLKLDAASFDELDERWQKRLSRDPALEMQFETLAREYEWSFRHLRDGAVPVVG